MRNDFKIGISMSGGGVRASVFHLGVLARLADEGLLEKVEMISSVSGGTLVCGLVYKMNNNKWPNSIEFSKVAEKIASLLTTKSLQIDALLRTFLTPWVMIGGRAKILSNSIHHLWGIKCDLNDIPPEPRWTINATTIESGKNFRFIPHKRMGDYLVHYADNPKLSLADAMCSSAAVPFLIGHYKLKTSNFKWFKYEGDAGKQVKPEFNTLHIWDGAAYDNLGLESLGKFSKGFVMREEINYLIVSDASQPLYCSASHFRNPKRLIDVTMDQVRALRARTIVDYFENNKLRGSYLKIGNTAKHVINAINATSPDTLKEELLLQEYLNETETKRASLYPTPLMQSWIIWINPPAMRQQHICATSGLGFPLSWLWGQRR